MYLGASIPWCLVLPAPRSLLTTFFPGVPHWVSPGLPVGLDPPPRILAHVYHLDLEMLMNKVP